MHLIYCALHKKSIAATCHRGDRRSARFRSNPTQSREKDERSGYHKRIGNAARLLSPECEAGTFAASGCNMKFKGCNSASGVGWHRSPNIFFLQIDAACCCSRWPSAVGGGRARSAANAKYAAIVVDANTGKTLFSANADAPRYPASLTKMMTLYLIFEALQRGKIKKSTPGAVLRACRGRAADQARRQGRRLGHASRRPSIRWSPSRPTTRRPRSPNCSAARKTASRA